MRVLITGGTGLIGRALTADLAREGHEVIVLSRDPARAKGLPDAARVERWDARTAGGWGPLADGADAIVNLAGENIASGRWTAERKRRIRDSRLNAARAVTEAVEAAARKPTVLIQASGVGLYADRGDEEVTEETPIGDDYLARVAIEVEESTTPLRDLGMRWVAIRTGIVLSTEGGALGRMILPVPLVCPGRFGSGRQWFPWIHIADEVAAIRFLMENEEARGPFNLVSPNPVTNAEFSRELKKELGRPIAIPVPALFLRLALGEMATALFRSERSAPQRLLQMGFTFRFPEVGPALRDLVGKKG